jgi:clan AA aspartic protease (TIGR02281 family)
LDAIDHKQTDLAVEYLSQMDNKKLDEVLLLAELMFEQARYELLFSTLYDFRYGLDNKSEQLLLSEIYRLVERVDVSLGEKNSYDRLVGIYRQLTSLEAEHTFYYLRLSYWLLQSGDALDASQSLLGAVNDIALEGQIRELQQAIDLYEDVGPQIEVPLKMVGEHYLISVGIAREISVELMIDTGASKTVIKRQHLINKIPELLNAAKSIEMNTANGRAKGMLVHLKNVGIGPLQLERLEVVLMSLPDFEYDGLLGMDVLSQFAFKIDQENSTLVLSPKKPLMATKL